VALLDERLRAGDRLMGRTAGAEAEAAVGERAIPARLQDLQDRLLDDAVENRGDAELADAAARLWYLDTANRLRPIGAGEQLALDGRPVCFQVRGEGVGGHAIDAGRALVATNVCERGLNIGRIAHLLHQMIVKRRVFGRVGRRWRFGPFLGERQSFTRLSVREVRDRNGFLPPLHEIDLLLALSFTPFRVPFGPSSGCRLLVLSGLLRPLLTSAHRSGRLAASPDRNPVKWTDLLG